MSICRFLLTDHFAYGCSEDTGLPEFDIEVVRESGWDRGDKESDRVSLNYLSYFFNFIC